MIYSKLNNLFTMTRITKTSLLRLKLLKIYLIRFQKLRVIKKSLTDSLNSLNMQNHKSKRNPGGLNVVATQHQPQQRQKLQIFPPLTHFFTVCARLWNSIRIDFTKIKITPSFLKIKQINLQDKPSSNAETNWFQTNTIKHKANIRSQ